MMRGGHLRKHGTITVVLAVACVAEPRGVRPTETQAIAREQSPVEAVLQEVVSSVPPVVETAPPPPPVPIEPPPGMAVVPACEWTQQLVGPTDVRTEVTRVARYLVDRLEVRVDEYAACVTARKCPSPRRSDHHCNWPRRSTRADHPINCVDQAAALAYCEYAGKRLPTADEWRAAASCEDAENYPWGNATPVPRHSTVEVSDRTDDDRLCWDGGDRVDILGDGEDWRAPRNFSGGTCAVGSFPSGANPLGVLDLAGNVWEWTSTLNEWNHRSLYVCGGGWRTLYHSSDMLIPNYQAGDRASIPPTTISSDIGIRCAKSIE